MAGNNGQGESSRKKLLPEGERSGTYGTLTDVAATEQEVLASLLRVEEVKPSFISIFSHATWYETVLLAICAVCAVVAGGLVPFTPLISSRIILAFARAESNGYSVKPLLDKYVVYYVYILITALVTWFISTAGFNFAGARITHRIKMRYFAAVLKQNMAFFDDNGSGDILSHLTDDTKAIQNAISSKLSQTISAFGSFITTIVVCFVLDWVLMLEMIWSFALGYGVLYLGTKLTVLYSGRSIEASSAGSAVVEEALGSIKTATSLGMQSYIHGKYMKFLTQAAKHGFVLSSLNQMLITICIASGYFNVALAFWQGSIRLTEGKTPFTSVVAISMISKAAAFCVLGVGSNLEAFAAATAGVGRLLRIIHRVSSIDSSSDEGYIPERFNSTLELRSVKHIYPCRPNVVTLKDVSIKFPMGQTTAIVGHSGSGKSSISNLLLRFYDPLVGRILLDGTDLSHYQLRWLRQQIAVVRQESFMFNRSIFENIACGFTGPQWETASSLERERAVYKAADIAQASDFIDRLPHGYDTVVGTRGSRLSGGQLQRIAIARALVGNPRILILDEATSALDSETEARLLSTMAGEDSKRTTIVIAHRLSTIRNSDNIVVLNAGRVVESGRHEDLLAAKSYYYDLVEAQNIEDQDHPVSSGTPGTANITPTHERAESPPETGGIHKAMAIDGDAKSIVSSSLWSMISFIFRLNEGESHWLIMGLICCIIVGFEEPASAFLFGKAITSISQPLDHADEILSDAAFYAWMFFALAIVMLIGFAVQGVTFAFSSEHLTKRVRSLALSQYLRMDISFFDKKENSAAALSGFLSNSATDLTGLSGSALGAIVICISSLVSGITLGFALGWKLALVCFAVVPLMMGGGYFGILLVGDFERNNELFANKAAEFAGETLNGIQTIAALTRENIALAEFEEILNGTKKDALFANLKASFMYALTQSAYYACMALSFWYGGQLILSGEYTLFQSIAVQSTMLMSAFSAGLVFSWTPNIGQAKQAAASLQRLLTRKSLIDPSSPYGEKLVPMRGDISFDSVSFSYPSRPNHHALDRVSFNIPAGANVAFVGATGSGKSTIISLIERFYDPIDGMVLVDSKPIRSLCLSEYRRCIGLVSQEPNLFSGTLKMNLTLGLGDNEKPTDEEIYHACREANIHDFIISLPEGYNTEVGSRGNQLSVGQKQRVVLARAILRRPKILLLDEATSALDSQSEASIQQALEKAKKGRTTITVAHRLSTIVKADRIYVMSEGRIVEAGTHTQLISLGGVYQRLYLASMSGQAL
ncbi:multidrug resistance protein 2 [Nannizzia gypsea CBS 118893]|uniref:Multidrug resistance protein 2 n=1 Tax=Arthroderma gypseum (strain ATCC MYA-4604 / CBS 118893) TaxID=535722 RepID=E4US98_ARTGP|nr:multidrug resistance protein 2 [Nannizzia gypsea CBS 118893]EFR01302.1 multidrug resistance protein 2 [Nannizzia gypsea CBS 118893]